MANDSTRCEIMNLLDWMKKRKWIWEDEWKKEYGYEMRYAAE